MAPSSTLRFRCSFTLYQSDWVSAMSFQGAAGLHPRGRFAPCTVGCADYGPFTPALLSPGHPVQARTPARAPAAPPRNLLRSPGPPLTGPGGPPASQFVQTGPHLRRRCVPVVIGFCKICKREAFLLQLIKNAAALRFRPSPGLFSWGNKGQAQAFWESVKGEIL